MGTNYYADWRPLSAPVTIQLHICKSHLWFQGSVFPSWRSWREFLLHNQNSLNVIDEYGVTIAVEKFVSDVDALAAELRPQHVEDLPTDGDTGEADWLDDVGFSFHRGEFS